MADVGDRIAVASKGKPRFGVVTAVKAALITVRWDTGVETSLIPGPGALSVVTSQRRNPSAQTRPTTSGPTAAARKTSAAGSRSGVAKKAAPGKRPVAKKAAPGEGAAVGKRPVVKKAPRGRKPMAMGTSSSRTTGKKTR